MDEPTDWIALDDEGFFALIGPVYQLRASGPTARFRFLAEPKHANRSHFVDGGMLTAFADRALGATARRSDPALRVATVQLDVHFLQPARLGDVVEMDCQIIRETRSLVVLDGTMATSRGAVALARGVWKLIPVTPES